MDDLDRLYHEFVEIARRERGAALAEPMTVLELYDELIPYRRVRDPADLRSNDDYELALSRMLAGERGYLLSDGNMQDEVRAGLEETLPDIKRYRAFPSVRVWLNPDEIPPPGHFRFAPPEVRDRAVWSAPPAEHRASPAHAHAQDSLGDEAQVEEAIAGEQLVEEEDYVEETDLDDVVLEGDVEGQPVEATANVQAESLEAEKLPRDADAGNPPEPSGSVDSVSELEVCPQCGTDSPVGAAFCPFCGARLRPEKCKACGAQLESAWRYCAACGAPRSQRDVGPA